MSAEWNLDEHSVDSVRIFQVYYNEEASHDQQLASDKRLLVLSHAIARSGTPAFFIGNPPDYMSAVVKGPMVIVFDVKEVFGQFNLAPYFETYSQVYDCSSPISDMLYDHIERAFVLMRYYEYIHLDPLYFSSFLLFPRSEVMSDAFLYRTIPIKKTSRLMIRTAINGHLSFVIDPRTPVETGAFILMPPYEHPFYVVDCSQENCTLSLLGIDQAKLVVNFRETVFVLLMMPPGQMQSYYKTEGVVQKVAPKIDVVTSRPMCRFETENIYDSDSDDDGDCTMSANFAVRDEPDDICVNVTSSVEYRDETIHDILSQIVSDHADRAVIFRCLGPEGVFPSHHIETNMIVANFLSFYRLEIGFSDAQVPYHTRMMIPTTTCVYEKVAIPNVVVSCDGVVKRIPADKVGDSWVQNRYRPISGAKHCHFIVINSDEVPIADVKGFFKRLRDVYGLCGLGNMTPLPQFDAFLSMPRKEVCPFLKSLFEGQLGLSEFQRTPVITFIVGLPIYDDNFHPHSVVSYVTKETIINATTDEISGFVFVVYSRIRLFSPPPYGMTMAAFSTRKASIFYHAFRYHPPCLLAHDKTKSITVHIAWDCPKKISSWIDDAGSILHVVQSDLPMIADTMRDIADSFVDLDVSFTFGLLAQGISQQSIDEIEAACGSLFSKTSVYCISMEPHVQALFEEEFDSDAIIFSDPEESKAPLEGEFKTPEATCYLIAHSLPTYRVSLFSAALGTAPKDNLRNYVEHMSHLSWVSVKPGPMRTVSFPPHVAALLRKNRNATSVVAGYEFLPCLDPSQ